MGIFDGYLMCVDFDGTVAERGKIVPRNIDAIRFFEQEGGRFTICTGRQPAFIVDNPLPIKLNAPLLCMNGTILYDLDRNEILKYWVSGRELWEWCEKLYLRYPKAITSIFSIRVDSRVSRTSTRITANE